MYHIDAETQIVLCTALFAATVYDQAGSAIGSSLDDDIEAEWKVHADADRKVVEEMDALVQEYRDAATVHGDFAEMRDAVVSAAKTAERVRASRYRHATRNAVAAALEQQLQAERRAAATMQRQIVAEGVEAVRQYFASAEAGPQLDADAVFVGTVRMETQEYSGNTAEEVKSEFRAEDLVDPVHKAFYSYLHHRLARAKSSQSEETASVEVPLLEKLMAATQDAVRTSLPPGMDATVEVLPPIEVEAAPTASRAMDAVAAINDKVFAQKQEPAPDMDVATLDWSDANAGAPDVDVEFVTDADGDRDLNVFVAQFEDDGEVPDEAAFDEYEYEYEEAEGDEKKE